MRKVIPSMVKERPRIKQSSKSRFSTMLKDNKEEKEEKKRLGKIKTPSFLAILILNGSRVLPNKTTGYLLLKK